MNIFVLDKDPWKIPKHYCDLHLNKMMVEYAQLLSNALPKGASPYKRTHYNHPCSIWVRSDDNNYNWLYSLIFYMQEEYKKRFGREHKSGKVALDLPMHLHATNTFPSPWPQCMPEEFKVATDNMSYFREIEAVVFAYRRYYAHKLRDFRKRGIYRYTRPLEEANGFNGKPIC